MNLKKLDLNDFPSWKEYYFQYQRLLAADYYIPLLKSWNVEILSDKLILDIGCGDGGFLSAFSELNCQCTGVEIKDFNWSNQKNITYKIGDITNANLNHQLKNEWDLIILRDVIEHIPHKIKPTFLNAISKLMSKHTKLLITFPPFYSPFGLHQQVLLKSIFSNMPYLSWVPKSILIPFLEFIGDEEKLTELTEIYDSKMTVRGFNALINQNSFFINKQEKYHIRPSHQIRYGINMKKTGLADFPLLQEFLVTGCTYLLSNPY